MEKIVTFDSLNKMFEEAKSAYSKKADNSLELVNSYLVTLQQYIKEKGSEFQKLVDFLLDFLLSIPGDLPKINEQLRNLLGEYDNTSLELEKSGTPLQEKDITCYNLGICYQGTGNVELAEKYYKKAIALSPQQGLFYLGLTALYETNNQREKIIDLYTDAVSKYPDIPEFYFELAYTYANNGKFEESIIYYDKALKFEGYQDRYIALNNKGLSYYSLKKPDEAVNCYKESIQLKPDFPDVYCNYAQALALTDKKEAEKYYKKAIELAPRKPSFYWELAAFYEGNNEIEKVIHLYKDAISNYNDIPEFYLWLADVYEKIEKFEESLIYCDKALEFQNYRDRYIVLNNKGVAYFGLKKIDKAINCYKESIQLNKEYPLVYYNYGLALKLSDTDDAAEQFKTSISLDPSYNPPQEELFNILMKKDEFTEVKKIFQELINRQKHPLGTSYFFLAYAQGELDENDEAISNYTKSYKIDKTATGALFNKAGLLKKLNRSGEARQCYETLIKDDPGNYQAYSNYAYFLMDENKSEEAISLIEKTLKSKNNQAEKYYDLGNIYLNSLAYEKARQYYDESIRIEPKSVFAQHNKAWIYQKLGDLKSARTEWKNAIDMYESVINEKGITADIPFYYAEALFYSMQSDDYKKIEALYRRGLEQNDKFTQSYLSLVNFYQLKQEVSQDGEGKQGAYPSQRNEDRIKMLECYRTGIQIVKNRNAKNPTRENLFELGSFYLAMNKYEQAIVFFKKVIEKDENYIRGYSALGVALLKNEQYKEAIKNFNASLDLDPDDLNMQSNLGDAYRKAEMYEKAEEIFRKILFVCPTYIDALIGLAECYKTLGDKAVDEKDMNKAEEYFSNAKDLLDKALGIPVDGASKRFMDAEKSAIYYSSGYTKVRLFELRGGFNLRLLQSAKRDFDRIQPAQAEYFKARKAMKKINQKIYELFSVKKGAPLIIFIIAIVLFCTMQYLYFFNRYTIKDEFSLDKKELASFLKKNKLDTLQKKVEVISDQSFSDVEDLNKKVADLIPSAYLDNLKAPLIKKDKIILKENISEAGYGLFTFGSLLFMVVGLFLRDITRLKVGSIEMDKNAVDNVSVTQSLVSK